jgi:RecA/RadA recombinase
MSLKDRLIKNSTIKLTSTLSESKIYNQKKVIQTRVPMINVAFSGKVNGGVTSGLTIFAGPSKHFKTGFTLLTAKAFLEAYPEGIILFYDSEFGSPDSYFASLGVDPDRVVHTPITNIEELKFDIMAQLDNIERGDEVLIMIDSVGNLASKKEVEDALKQNTAADMTRAKQLKSLFRMVTPHLTIKNIPMIVVNHTYQTQEMYSKAVVSGGTGIYYSADNIFIIGRQQEKTDKTIDGYHFILNVEKSRYVKEKSKIPISVMYNGGINKWSGLLELAMLGTYIAKPKNGWYQVVDRETGELTGKMYREADIEANAEVWNHILQNTDFAKFIENTFKLPQSKLLEDENLNLEGALDEEDEDYPISNDYVEAGSGIIPNSLRDDT